WRVKNRPNLDVLKSAIQGLLLQQTALAIIMAPSASPAFAATEAGTTGTAAASATGTTAVAVGAAAAVTVVAVAASDSDSTSTSTSTSTSVTK
ncbi:hypothetical protein OFC58_29080, partial [Escherichia coli]|nr:hypothetical protein [Escherichia coli]